MYRVRLLIDVPNLYRHSRDKLGHLSHDGKSTGGLFGVVKTVDACVRRFEPEVVILCYDDINASKNTYFADDALQLGVWGSVHGFHTAYLRGDYSGAAIQKIVLDQISSDKDKNLRVVVQTWNPDIKTLLFDQRVGLIGKSGDPLYEQSDFEAEFGYHPVRLTKNMSYAQGDLSTTTPNPNSNALRVWLEDRGFDSIIKQLDDGEVPVIRRGITL